MATQTQTATPSHDYPHARTHPHAHSPHKSVRKRLSHISPARAVVSIIAPRRHSSHADFSAIRLADAPSDASPTRPQEQPKKQRTVSTPAPVRRMETSSSKTSGGGDIEEEGETQDADESTSGPNASMARREALTFPHVANLFVRLRRAQRRAKAHHIDSDSGPEPVTHECLRVSASSGEAGAPAKRARLEVQETFVCTGGVDLTKLLRATRTALLERAGAFGADVLVEEQWWCSIREPKHRSDGTYRVHVRYAATAAATPTSDAGNFRDPHQPVTLERVQDKPGLMTIVSRDLASVNVLDVFPTEFEAS